MRQTRSKRARPITLPTDETRTQLRRLEEQVDDAITTTSTMNASRLRTRPTPLNRVSIRIASNRCTRASARSTRDEDASRAPDSGRPERRAQPGWIGGTDRAAQGSRSNIPACSHRSPEPPIGEALRSMRTGQSNGHPSRWTRSTGTTPPDRPESLLKVAGSQAALHADGGRALERNVAVIEACRARLLTESTFWFVELRSAGWPRYSMRSCMGRTTSKKIW